MVDGELQISVDTLRTENKKTSTPLRGSHSLEDVKDRTISERSRIVPEDISTIKKPITPSKDTRKVRPFLACFKSESRQTKEPGSSQINEKNPKNREKRWINLKASLTSDTSTPSPRRLEVFDDSAHPSEHFYGGKEANINCSMGNSNVAKKKLEGLEGKAKAIQSQELGKMKSRRVVTLAPNDNNETNNRSRVHCEESAMPRNRNKDDDVGDASDEDIVVIDENGEKIQERYAKRGHSITVERKESQSVLCDFNRHVITAHDYKTLEDGEYLNDSIIDFYLTFLYERRLSKSAQNDIHIYSNHFYSRLKGGYSNRASRDKSGSLPKQPKADCAYQRVKSWTRKIDIFSKRMLIFPICDEEHWYLIIVCNPRLVISQSQSGDKNNFSTENSKTEIPFLLVLDSLGGTQPKVTQKIRSYLQYEYLERRGAVLSFSKDNMTQIVPQIPQQPNSCDCGIYLLHYIELIFQNPNHYWGPKFPNLTNWFPSEQIDNKREEIAILIQELAHEEPEELGNNPESKKVSKPKVVFPNIKFSGIESKWGSRSTSRGRTYTSTLRSKLNIKDSSDELFQPTTKLRSQKETPKGNLSSTQTAISPKHKRVVTFVKKPEAILPEALGPSLLQGPSSPYSSSSRSSINDEEEKCMLFQSPPREAVTKNKTNLSEGRLGRIAKKKNDLQDKIPCTSTERFQAEFKGENKRCSPRTYSVNTPGRKQLKPMLDIRCEGEKSRNESSQHGSPSNKTSTGYDTSDNMKYFGSGYRNQPDTSMVSRLANAFNEHDSRINDTSMGNQYRVVGRKKPRNDPYGSSNDDKSYIIKKELSRCGGQSSQMEKNSDAQKLRARTVRLQHESMPDKVRLFHAPHIKCNKLDVLKVQNTLYAFFIVF